MKKAARNIGSLKKPSKPWSGGSPPNNVTQFNPITHSPIIQRQPETLAQPSIPIHPLPIFYQRRRFAAYHEQGQAPAPHAALTIFSLKPLHSPEAACVAQRSCEAKIRNAVIPAQAEILFDIQK